MKSLVKTLLVLSLFSACKNQPAPPPPPTAPVEASAILKHKYWVSKPFNDALFAKNIIDTISYLPCGELVFSQKDTLLMTACLSDAGRGVYKSTSANTLEILFEGFEGKPCVARLDESTGILHVDAPAGVETGWPTDFVAHDDIDVTNLDNVTINLGRKRLAGNYTMLPQKGGAAATAPLELRADGTQSGLGDFDQYEPWPSGIGGGSVLDPARNVMYLVKKGKEIGLPALAWQVHGDTLRLWDTKDISAEGDMPEYKVTKLKGAYLKTK